MPLILVGWLATSAHVVLPRVWSFSHLVSEYADNATMANSQSTSLTRKTETNNNKKELKRNKTKKTSYLEGLSECRAHFHLVSIEVNIFCWEWVQAHRDRHTFHPWSVMGLIVLSSRVEVLHRIRITMLCVFCIRIRVLEISKIAGVFGTAQLDTKLQWINLQRGEFCINSTRF